MANPEHLEILKRGVEVWNRWREENPDVRPDLINANFQKAKLREANFRKAELIGANISKTDLNMANLSKADLREAILRRANLDGANFSNADLRKADLREADLSYANLSNADFRDALVSRANLKSADLREADLSGAQLSNADFRDALLKRANFDGASLLWAKIINADLNGTILDRTAIASTVFGNVDLSGTNGLETVQHEGPSTIGIDTIYASGGKIPEVFLRGCGVPENFIQFMGSLTAKAFEYYSCFISYSSKDQDFAERLHANPQNKGVRCWFAPEDMKIGDKIRDRIDQSIRIHDKLLLILSEHSINSEWVEDEVEAAYEQERQRGKTVLFPIRLDSAVMDTDKAWASKLRRQRHIGDFTHWKDHDAYQKAFDRLMKDLKAEEPSGSD